ncbi:MAG: SRPBCC family protein [Candidatus Promineifilaceae bacterium]|nr:SRPBCC family protein [Candidatus Promineifilaceae bacterium]
MATTEISAYVERPAEEVFAFVADIGRLQEWVEVIQDARPTSDRQNVVGATYLVTARFAGRTMEIPSRIEVYEPGRQYGYRAWGSLPYVSTITLEAAGDGTQVTERIVMESDGLLGRFLDQLKIRISRRSHKKNWVILKSILEGSGEAALAG